MLLDYLTFETDVGAPGFVVSILSCQTTIKLRMKSLGDLELTIDFFSTNVTNTTVEETDSALTYVGTWGHNTSPLFSGNGSSYTNGVGASVSLSFKGKFSDYFTVLSKFYS